MTKQYFDTFRRDIHSIINIHDGDTLTALVENGFDDLRRVTFRLDGINTAEIGSTTSERKALASKARDYVRTTLDGKQVAIESIKFKDGSFSRYLGTIFYLENGQWKNLNKELLDLHLAQTYYKGASKDEGEFK